MRAAFQRASKLPDSSRLISTIDSLRVVGRCGCGCDSVDFARHDAPRPSGIVADGIGTTRAGGQVGVLVWASGEVLTGLEIYDMGAGDADLKLPLPSSIHGWEPEKT